MPPSVLGAQLYTLREYLKIPSDIAKTLARVRKMGYEAVQCSGLGPIETRELARILDGEGLACVVTHRPFEEFKNIDAALEYHGLLKCRYGAIGGFGWNNESAAQWRRFAIDFSATAKTLAARGLFLGYHNHSHELARLVESPVVPAPAVAKLPAGGLAGVPATPLQLLIDSCDRTVWFEIDTYWIQHGGGDPALWIDKVAGRIPCVHLKDMTVTPQRQQKMCEVGAGNLNWPRILDACRRAQVQWYLVERDDGDLDPFDSLQLSLNNLRAMGLH
jgi:sugar phosphate isomerase/epimerase